MGNNNAFRYRGKCSILEEAHTWEGHWRDYESDAKEDLRRHREIFHPQPKMEIQVEENLISHGAKR